MEWQKINMIMEQRTQEFEVNDGVIDRKLGIRHLFPNREGEDDYEDNIKRGDDSRILGRYVDVENLGSDITFDLNSEFQNGTLVSKGGKRKMTVDLRKTTVKFKPLLLDDVDLDIKAEEVKQGY